MKILKGIEIIDLALFVDSTLIISDVHIGYEEALNKQGILVPRTQFGEIVKQTEKILEKLKNEKIKTIIINGDLKHEFGTISEEEWRNTLKCSEIILIKGNHDKILGPIAKKRNITVLEDYVIESKHGKIMVLHGDKIPGKKEFGNVSAIIIGHEHPAVSLKDGPRIENYKCFLKGKFRGKTLIVQPSFNTMTEGTNMLRDEILSPFLKQNLGSFEVFIVEDKVYNFGKLKTLNR